MTTHNNVLELIGNTPIVKINNFDTGCCQLYAKLELNNPGGSIKDRMALAMVEDAEASGKLKPGATIVEATAGNTGLSLALVAIIKGYKLLLVMPDKMSQDKVSHLRAMGVEVVMTRSDVQKGHPDYYQDKAEAIAKEMPNSYYINQFGNPANPRAHELTTGPEIWEQMDHNLDAIVCGVGSSGGFTGIGRFMKSVDPNIEMIIADPEGSILAEVVNNNRMTEAGSWLVEGIGEDFIPSITEIELAKKAYSISDKESFDTGRELLKREGIFGGSSTGTILAAALKYCQEQTKPKRVVMFACDSGNKYLSKMYNDTWLKEKGLD